MNGLLLIFFCKIFSSLGMFGEKCYTNFLGGGVTYFFLLDISITGIILLDLCDLWFRVFFSILDQISISIFKFQLIGQDYEIILPCLCGY